MEIAGNAAFLFNLRETKNLAACLEKLLKNENERNILKQKAQEQLKKFSWRETAQKYLEIYKNLN